MSRARSPSRASTDFCSRPMASARPASAASADSSCSSAARSWSRLFSKSRLAAVWMEDARERSVFACSAATRAVSTIAGPAPSGWAIWTPSIDTRSPSGVTALRAGWRATRARAVAHPSTRSTSPSRWRARPRSARGPSRSTRASTPDAAAISEAGADPRFTADTTGTPPPPAALTVSTASLSRSTLWKAMASAQRPRAASTAFSNPAGMSRRETRAPSAPSTVSTLRRDSTSKLPDMAASKASTLASVAATANLASVIASSAPDQAF